jgi:hypothetical protein
MSYRYQALQRPWVACSLGVLVAAACFVGLALIWGDGVAAAAYQWRLSAYREAQARVVDTYVQRRGRSGTTWEVVLDTAGTRQTIDVQHQQLFNDLKPGQTVQERLVMNRVVAIRAGGQVLPIEDNLAWMVGLPGGIILGVLLIVLGLRAGFAKGFISRKAMESYQASTFGLPEGLLFLACAALALSGISIGLVELATGTTTPLPVVVLLMSAFTVGGAVLSVRMVRMARAPADPTSRRSPRRSIGDLITVVVVPAKGGIWDVSFIGDEPLPKDFTVGAISETTLRSIDALVAATRKSRPVDVSLLWYPQESKRGRHSHGGAMIFDVDRKSGRFTATLDRHPEITASSATFEGLAGAVQAVKGELESEPAEWCITWDRTLTSTGFVESGQDTTPI